MKMTYQKMIKECEKKVAHANKEIHAVKWLFFNCDFFCGYSHLNDEVPTKHYQQFLHYIDLYINEDIPPQYILNKTFFFNYPFYVDEGCFIPRYETEQLVEECIYRIDEKFEEKKIKIADVCCGSGAIGITLKKEIKNSEVYLYELSAEAIKIAQKNAVNLKADVVITQGDFIQPILNQKMKFDVLMCNPPYIKNDEILDKMVVAHEPNMALFGGNDGLDFYKIIFDHFDELLNNNGFMGFEFGYDQKESLEKLINEKLKDVEYEFLKDYANLDRMLFIYKK